LNKKDIATTAAHPAADLMMLLPRLPAPMIKPLSFIINYYRLSIALFLLLPIHKYTFPHKENYTTMFGKWPEPLFFKNHASKPGFQKP
jgi:hypothetical protein